MSCPYCGCHMVSRAGERPWSRSGPLVCTRCNQPVPTPSAPVEPGRRLRHLAALLTLLCLGGVVFTLATLHDLRSPPSEPERSSQGEEG